MLYSIYFTRRIKSQEPSKGYSPLVLKGCIIKNIPKWQTPLAANFRIRHKWWQQSIQCLLTLSLFYHFKWSQFNQTTSLPECLQRILAIWAWFWQSELLMPVVHWSFHTEMIPAPSCSIKKPITSRRRMLGSYCTWFFLQNSHQKCHTMPSEKQLPGGLPLLLQLLLLQSI